MPTYMKNWPPFGYKGWKLYPKLLGKPLAADTTRPLLNIDTAFGGCARPPALCLLLAPKKKKIAKKNRQIFSISRTFIRKNLPRVKCRLCIQSFIILGQGVPELHVRTDTQSNFVPKSISIFESQIHRCFLDLHTTEQCIHSTNEKLLFKTT